MNALTNWDSFPEFAGLVLFRFFDILKPLFIRRLEKLPLGYGVMADDVLAGIYAQLVMQVVVRMI